MINTERVIGYYNDIFGNEINEYEQIERYTVMYKGFLFEGDSDGYNKHNFDRWEDAYTIYQAYPDIVSIRDNEYGVTLEDGEWYKTWAFPLNEKPCAKKGTFRRGDM